jgi:uncharacterized protein
MTSTDSVPAERDSAPGHPDAAQKEVASPTASHAEHESLPQRVLGRTGEKVPILGLGTAPAGMGMGDSDAITLFEAAIDQGVTYIDTAPGYERAQKQLRQILPRRRDEIFLVTKTNTSDRKEAIHKLEEALRELNTDAVDLTYVHSMGNQDTDQVLSSEGALAGLREAQRRGLTRYIGVTGHSLPQRVQRVIEEDDIDVIMIALNFADRLTYGFDQSVLPAAMARNVGVAAMKVYGGAEAMKYDTTDHERRRPSAIEAVIDEFDYELALRWALSLPGVATAVVGMYTHQELRQNIEWARGARPLDEAQLQKLQTQAERLATHWGEHYGPCHEQPRWRKWLQRLRPGR